MTSLYSEDESLDGKFYSIKKAIKSAVEDQIKAQKLYSDYVNSLGVFPRWFSIISGLGVYFNVFNKYILGLAFLCFLVSALFILYTKRSAAKRSLHLVDELYQETHLLQELHWALIQYSRGKISPKDWQKANEDWSSGWTKRRPNFGTSLGSGSLENNLVETSFWITAAGGAFLASALIVSIFCP